MQKRPKNAIKSFFLTKYYEYNFKKDTTFNTKYEIIREQFNLISSINYNKLILKLIIWYKIKKYNQKYCYKKIINLKNKRISKTDYRKLYFYKMYKNIELYFYTNKQRFLFKKSIKTNNFFNSQKNMKFSKVLSKGLLLSNVKRTKRQIHLIKKKLWFLNSKQLLRKKLKLPKWKLDRLYFFKKFFFKFSPKVKLKKVVISQIQLYDYTLRSKFKTSINLENVKTYYGVIKIKPSGANIFVTLTNFSGDVISSLSAGIFNEVRRLQQKNSKEVLRQLGRVIAYKLLLCNFREMLLNLVITTIKIKKIFKSILQGILSVYPIKISRLIIKRLITRNGVKLKKLPRK